MSSPRYFQGNSVHGPVKASPAQKFREVVDALRVCPVLGIGHKEFLELGEKERNEAKQVPFFVPAVFKTSPSKRTYENALHCNLIFLDIDPEKEMKDGKWVENGKYPAAAFTRDPNRLHTALAGLNFAAHLTASSTPSRPRMRVIVDAESIPLSAYPQAAQTIGRMLGLPVITKESKVAVQPMFLPVMFSDSSDDEHPLLAFSISGRTFTTKDIGEDFDVQTVASRTSESFSTGIDALEFLRAPVPEITLAVAKEALFNIDADLSRDAWRDVAASLKHQFSPKQTEEAFELFNEWSATGDKYQGEDDARRMWNSLRPTPIGRMPVTIRTLLKLAVSSGWDDKKVKDSCFNILIRWMEECDSISALMERGVHKIMATPLLSAVQEDVLVNQLCAQAKKRFAYTISATAIRKDIARTKAEIKAQEKPAEKIKEPLWAKGVCYISAADEFYRHRSGEKYKTASFNASYSRWLLPTEEALKDAGLPVTPANLSQPIVPPSVYALNHLKIPAVYDYAYDPSQPTEMFFVDRGRKFVNTYTPTHPEMDYKRADEAGEMLQMHLKNLIGEPDYARRKTDYMSYLVQYPGRKIRWAPLIQGVEGCGKTFLAELMKAVLGQGHVKTINGTAVTGGWNEWAFGYQLVVLEEVRVAGTSKHDVMNRLKEWITNDEIPINEKFRNSRDVENITNYMLFSNHHDALALTPGDRRYFVIKSAMQHRNHVLGLGENYFPKLFNMLRDFPGAMRAYLANWEISSDFNPDGHAPRTTYATEMVNDSANDLVACIRRLLLEGDYPLIQYDIVSTKTLMDVIQLEESLHKVSMQTISHALREEGFRQIGRHLFGTERHYLWIRGGTDESTAVDEAARRVKNNLKNLQMELLF